MIENQGIRAYKYKTGEYVDLIENVPEKDNYVKIMEDYNNLCNNRRILDTK